MQSDSNPVLRHVHQNVRGFCVEYVHPYNDGRILWEEAPAGSISVAWIPPIRDEHGNVVYEECSGAEYALYCTDNIYEARCDSQEDMIILGSLAACSTVPKRILLPAGAEVDAPHSGETIRAYIGRISRTEHLAHLADMPESMLELVGDIPAHPGIANVRIADD